MGAELHRSDEWNIGKSPPVEAMAIAPPLKVISGELNFLRHFGLFFALSILSILHNSNIVSAHHCIISVSYYH
jgi:hypothetical protein